jgi:hypothetical protein
METRSQLHAAPALLTRKERQTDRHIHNRVLLYAVRKWNIEINFGSECLAV